MSYAVLESLHLRHSSYSSGSLEDIPSELLFEIAKYLDAADLLVLRQTSNRLYTFSSAHQVWLSLAQAIAYEQALPLPSGRTIFNATTSELVSALLRARHLRRLLYNEDSLIRLRGPVTSLLLPGAGMFGRTLMLGLLDGGKYLIGVISDTLSCFNVLTGRIIADVKIHGAVEMWNTMSRLEPDGTETCLIALHLSPPDFLRTYAIPYGGCIAIYALTQSPETDPWPTASFSEVLSVPISISVSSLSVDTQTISAAGLSAGPSPVVSFLFINHITLKSFVLDTGVEHHQNSVVDIFISRKEVVAYIEKETMAQSLAYELENLMEIANRSSDCEVVRLPPTHIRVSPLESSMMPDYWNTRSNQDAWGSGRIANHEYLPVCSSMTRVDGASVFKSKVHDHIFQSLAGMEEHNVMQVVTTDDGVYLRHGRAMTWIFPGFVVYISSKTEAVDAVLRLIIFHHRREGQESILSHTISLPSFIDVANIRRVNFDEAWGIFVLSMENVPGLVHIVHLI